MFQAHLTKANLILIFGKPNLNLRISIINEESLESRNHHIETLKSGIVVMPTLSLLVA